MAKLVLASASPRRSQILEEMRVDFEVMPVEVDERVIQEDWMQSAQAPSPQEMTERCAMRKTCAGSALRPKDWVMGCDTMVFFGSEPLGKPQDAQEARQMLRKLSGREHVVYTSMVLRNETLGLQGARTDCARITFDELTEQEIEDYVRSGEGLDKAGAYAIQGVGGQFIRSIAGDYWATVGLSKFSVRHLLREMARQHEDRTGEKIRFYQTTDEI